MMKTRYIDLIEQTFEFPQVEFNLEEDRLIFQGVDLMELIETYGTPLKISYLPKIGENIYNAKHWFKQAMQKRNYQGQYYYCYCTKSSHFKHVIEEVLKHDTHIETSSGYDIDIVRSIYKEGLLSKDQFLICNGYKTADYHQKIIDLIEDDFNVIPVIDNKEEFFNLYEDSNKSFNIGIRIASEEEPKFAFYTSRLGIGYKDIPIFYRDVISKKENVKLKMLHFFINTGIRDNAYYWSELTKCLKVYCDLKKSCPDLHILNIGGGFPIKNSLGFNFNYEEIINYIIEIISNVCKDEGVPVPDIMTEFGSYTVGESGATLYKIENQKLQNDRERWNMINSSFMTTLPDSWAINTKFIMLPVNRWYDNYERVLLGGLTCDSDDYYNSEQHANAIYLPYYNKNKPLYIGFFHTGAYQESVGGYGGIQHCLVPQPKFIIIDRAEDGKLKHKIFRQEQTAPDMLKILGYEK